MGFEHTREGYLKVAGAIQEAVFEASIDPVQKVAFLNSGDILEAALMIAATTSATSGALSTPAKRLEFSKQVGKRFLKLVVAAQEHFAEEGAPFETATLGERTS